MFDLVNKINDHRGTFLTGCRAIFCKTGFTIAEKVLFDSFGSVMFANGGELIQKSDIRPTLMHPVAETENPDQRTMTGVVELFDLTGFGAMTVRDVKIGELFNKIIAKFNHPVSFAAERIGNAFSNDTGNDTDNGNDNFSHTHISFDGDNIHQFEQNARETNKMTDEERKMLYECSVYTVDIKTIAFISLGTSLFSLIFNLVALALVILNTGGVK